MAEQRCGAGGGRWKGSLGGWRRAWLAVHVVCNSEQRRRDQQGRHPAISVRPGACSPFQGPPCSGTRASIVAPTFASAQPGAALPQGRRRPCRSPAPLPACLSVSRRRTNIAEGDESMEFETSKGVKVVSSFDAMGLREELLRGEHWGQAAQGSASRPPRGAAVGAEENVAHCCSAQPRLQACPVPAPCCVESAYEQLPLAGG